MNIVRYGALEGHSKPGLANLYGVEIVQKWREGLLERPPAMTPGTVVCAVFIIVSLAFVFQFASSLHVVVVVYIVMIMDFIYCNIFC